MKKLKLLLAVILFLVMFVLGAVFYTNNSATAAVDLFGLALPEAPVSVWILLSFALGGLGGIAVSLVAITRLRTALMLERRRGRQAGKELDKLRAS